MEQRFRLGDHLKVDRGHYSHHGIWVGGRWPIIHFAGESPMTKRGNRIRRTNLDRFESGDKVVVVEYGASDSPSVVVERAESRLGQMDYALFGNNCEHFASWCKTGVQRSKQVQKGTGGGAGGVTIVGAAAATPALIGAAGVVGGVSGAGIMSGLGTVGGFVGGGVVAGVASLAIVPVGGVVLATRYALGDDENDTDAERKARAAGRTAVAVGGVAATAGSVATIGAAGTVAGLSGAGISAGLAAIGGTVGGGMLAGTAMAVAAPAAVAGAAAIGVYKLWQWLGE